MIVQCFNKGIKRLRILISEKLLGRKLGKQDFSRLVFFLGENYQYLWGTQSSISKKNRLVQKKFNLNNFYNQNMINNIEKLNRIIKQSGRSEEISEIGEWINQQMQSRCVGAFLGFLIGDSLGAYCETKKSVSEDLLNTVMKMPGGGYYKTLSPGQVTSNSQISIMLIRSLLLYDKKTSLQDQMTSFLYTIGSVYSCWRLSTPFDFSENDPVGSAITVFQYCLLDEDDEAELSKGLVECYKQVAKDNKDLHSSKCLPRSVPMAIFQALLFKYQGHDDEGLRKSLKSLKKKETSMTHPNKICCSIVEQWSDVQAKIIEGKDLKEVYREMKQSNVQFQWKKQERNPKQTVLKAEQIKVPYLMAMQKLRVLSQAKKINEQLFLKIVREAISEGGCTSLNACIIGALAGAVVGFENIPQKYLKILFSHKSDSGQQKRPTLFQPFLAFKKFIELIQKFQQ